MRFQEKVLFLLERQNVKDLTAKKDIFYYSQIAKRQNYYNVGKGLVLSMFEELRKRKISIIICRIIHGPIKNEKSISFHQKLGFYCIGDVDYNNYQIGIYFKKL
jgi:L-amino acid N-acyltransferase YncA